MYRCAEPSSWDYTLNYCTSPRASTCHGTEPARLRKNPQNMSRLCLAEAVTELCILDFFNWVPPFASRLPQSLSSRTQKRQSRPQAHGSACTLVAATQDIALDSRGNVDGILAGTRDPSHQNAQTGAGVHPTSYSIGTGGQVAGAWSWPFTFVYCSGWEWVDLCLHSFMCLHGVDTDNFVVHKKGDF